ncbi:MAG: S49 family peptidase [Rhodospirillales bacterium]|nr:S49 family peptidase [Rhodospirillales bacterium]
MLAARRGALNAETLAPVIAAAFRAARGRVVVLDIDSPGGSPVQSDAIARLIRRHAEERGVRVIAVIGEVGASGGYWLACAADEIVANPMSIVGSIGVRGGGFGFTRVIERLGIERRQMTAGVNKARLDPFAPERAEDREFLQRLLDDLHARFRDWVTTRRGTKLRGDPAGLFDGGFLLGAAAEACGLVDRLGDLDQVVRELGGAKARMRVFRPRKPGLLRRLPGLLLAGVAEAVAAERGRVEF